MIVLKMLRKMPDHGAYVINTEHANSAKFIEAVRLIMDENWIGKFKKAFSVYFNVDMNQVLKIEHPRRNIWADYFERRALNDRAMEAHRNSSARNDYTFVVVGKHETYKQKLFNR